VIKKGVLGYGLTAGALPDFWLALILIYVFFYQLNIAPAPMGRLDLGVSPPDQVTGFYLVDSLLDLNLEAFSSALAHLILPVFTLVFVYGAPILKMTQMTMIKMTNEKFVKHPQNMGLKEAWVHKYALQNALPPIVTVIGLTYSYLLGGAVLVEFIFGWGGLGQYAVSAIRNGDYAPIQAFVLLATVMNLAVYLIVDIIYILINPKVDI
jgi:peptide/nickel transport system permease protein